MTQDEKAELLKGLKGLFYTIGEARNDFSTCAADDEHYSQQEAVLRAAIAALEALPVEEPTTGDAVRFFIDHGMIHDRLTGKHVTTEPIQFGDDQWDTSPVTETCALLNALAQSQPTPDKDEAGWQPIETAPKDGSEVLVCWADGSLELVKWHDPSREGREGFWMSEIGDEYGNVSHPTHWMPLTAPPT